MSSVAERVVLISAALLPARVRARYREQWLADIRDAPGLGMRASEIAIGSLAFAATFARPLPSRTRPGSGTVARRVRLSIALSLSALILAFSQTASAPWNAQTGTDFESSMVGVIWTLLTIYVGAAQLAALVTVFATRGIPWRVRGTIVVAAGVTALMGTEWSAWLSARLYEPEILALATVGLPAIGILLACIAVLVPRQRTQLGVVLRSRSVSAGRVRAVVAGLMVAAVVCAGFALASALWDGRAPLRVGLAHNTWQYRQWFAAKTAIEHMVATTLEAWLVAGLVIAVVIAAESLGRGSTLRRTVILAAMALIAVGLSLGALVSFLQYILASIAAGFPVGLGTELDEIGMIVVLLVTVRERHPVASGNESFRQNLGWPKPAQPRR